MNQTDYYEVVRQKLKLGPVYAPKHKKIYELLKLLWNEEEIKLLSYFEGVGKMLSPRKLSKISGLPKEQVKAILDRLAERGTILKVGNQYGLLPLLPGVFELYYSVYYDTKEKLTEIAKIYRFIFDNILPQQLLNSNFTLFRPLLPYESKEKYITIDKSIDSQPQVLPYELVENLIHQNDLWVVKPCDCRKIGELTGEPCSIASSEMGCLFCGMAAQFLLDRGIGKKLSKEEAFEFLKETEKAGLVHNAVNTSGPVSSMIICNCCSCHCGALISAREHKKVGTVASNYNPRFINELCTKCELCLQKCPMGAIYHHFPNKEDKSDEYMYINADYCIGCGVCAVTCPNKAIRLVKVRDDKFDKKYKIGNKTFLELLM